MNDEFMGNGLPMLITLTGENPEMMGRTRFMRTFRRKFRMKGEYPLNPEMMGFFWKKKRKQTIILPPLSTPVVSPGLIQTVVPPPPPALAPSTIQTTSPDTTDFSENRDGDGGERDIQPAEDMQGMGSNLLFIAAGMGLLYILAKNKIIRL